MYFSSWPHCSKGKGNEACWQHLHNRHYWTGIIRNTSNTQSKLLSIPGIFKMMHYGILFNMPYSECHTTIYNKPSDAPDENGLLDMRSNTPPLISSVLSSRSSVGSIDINVYEMSHALIQTKSFFLFCFGTECKSLFLKWVRLSNKELLPVYKEVYRYMHLCNLG